LSPKQDDIYHHRPQQLILSSAAIFTLLTKNSHFSSVIWCYYFEWPQLLVTCCRVAKVKHQAHLLPHSCTVDWRPCEV